MTVRTRIHRRLAHPSTTPRARGAAAARWAAEGPASSVASSASPVAPPAATPEISGAPGPGPLRVAPMPPVPAEPSPDGAARRRGALRALGLTALSAAVPGAGLVAAGRRRGWIALAPALLAAVVASTLVRSSWARDAALDAARAGAFDPTVMLAVAVGAAALALAWSAVVVATAVAARPRRATRAQRALGVLATAALVAAVSVPLGTASAYAQSNRSLLLGVFGEDAPAPAADHREPGAARPAAAPWAGEPRLNVLLVGADTGADRTGTRPDTLVVASADTRTGDTVLISVPRQLSDIPFPAGSPAAAAWPAACAANGAGGCMLNATYLFGTQHPELFPGEADPGIAATRAAVSSVVGLDVHRYVSVDLQGFQDLVDAMGGLTLDVPRDIPIGGGTNLATGGKYPITDWIRAGAGQHLDGYRTLWFARSREGSDNNERMHRQQCVLEAAVDQYAASDLARAFPRLAATAERSIQTDITASELDALVDLGLLVEGAPLRSLSLTIDKIDTAHPDYAAVHALVQQVLVPPPPPAPAAVAVPQPGAAVVPAPAPAPAPATGGAAPADTGC